MPRNRILLLLGVIGACVLPALAAQEMRWLPGGVATSGLQFAREDTWTIGRSEIINPTDESGEFLLAISFLPTPYVQYTWKVWVPAQSRREVYVPIRAQEISEERGVDVEVMLDPDAKTVKAREKGLMRLEKGRPAMGMLRDRNDDPAAIAATAMRLGARQPRRIAYLRDRSVPPIFVGWEGLDSLVISHDAPNLDPAQMDALRDWLVSGGRLWVIAEQVDPALLARLLGDDWTCEIMDHVELNRFTIAGANASAELDFEVPVDMARVYAPGWEVIHEVRGWPASLVKRFGLGWVVVTTVGPRAWYEIGWEKKPDKPDKRVEVPREPLRELGRIITRNYDKPPLPAGELAAFAAGQIGHKTLDRAWVGWILGTYVVLFAVSGLFLTRARRLEHSAWLGSGLAVVASLALVGVGVAHQGKVPLTIAEAQVARIVPHQHHAIVNGALAIYSPTEDKGPLKAEAGGGVWPNLSLQKGEQLRLRWDDVDKWVWDGLRLPSGAVLSARFRHTVGLEEQVSASIRFGPDGVEGRLVPGPFKKFEDSVLLTPRGQFAVSLKSDRTFRIGTGDELGRGSYVGGTTMSNEQIRRQALLRKMFEARIRRAPIFELESDEPQHEALAKPELTDSIRRSFASARTGKVKLTRRARISILMHGAKWRIVDEQKGRERLFDILYEDGALNVYDVTQTAGPQHAGAASYHHPSVATLYAWTDAFPLGFTLPQDPVIDSTNVIALPVDIEPTPPGTRVTIPSGFIEFDPWRIAGKAGGSTLYKKDRDEWVESSNRSEIVLRFQLPPSTLPLEIESARWTIVMDAPGRDVEAEYLDVTPGVDGGDPEIRTVPLDDARSKIGVWQIDLPASTVRHDADGGIVVGLKVGDAGGAAGQWKIERMQMTVTGRVAE
ncbi:MAG: hypothetical protein CMJ18_15835 [Phycisphaeraceae bacterium]|nr:hypothetical protein [Phycisphaeraceae bacterium]